MKLRTSGRKELNFTLNSISGSKSNMLCLLCLGIDCDEHLIDIDSAESRRQNIASTLHTHFRFCFQEEPVEGYMCQKCWVKVSVFHEFYTHIEYVHRSNESIFVESLVDDDIKPESDRGEWVDESPAYKSSIDENLEKVPIGKKETPRKDTSVKSEDSNSESDQAEHFDDNSDITIADSTAQLTTEVPVTVKVYPDNVQHQAIKVKKPKAKRKEAASLKDYKNGDVADEKNSDDPTRLKPNRKPSRRRNESGTFQCNECKMHFLAFNRLERHIKQTHNVKEFQCGEARCVDSFETQQLLDDHFARRHKRTECPHCKKMFVESSIAQHIQMTHENKAAAVICELCGQVSQDKQKHAAHLKRAHDPRGSLQCDICGQCCKSLINMRRHISSRHAHGPQICGICGHISPSKRGLTAHKRIHRPDEKNRFKCDVCDRGFSIKYKLREHYHIHTGTAGSHHCDECGKTFRFSSSFSVHKKKMHPK